MKPSRTKKSGSSAGSESERSGPMSHPESLETTGGDETGGQKNEQADRPAAATGRPASGAASTPSKASRREREKPSPPVRIVADSPTARERIPKGGKVRTKQQGEQGQNTPVRPSPELIAQRAYALYEAAGYEPGREVEHWLEAERQLEAEARNRHRS